VGTNAESNPNPMWDGYHKSSFSESGNCVEVAFSRTGEVKLRDSKSPHGAELRFSEPEWQAFLRGVFDGQFDGPVGD
jgi:hypothetical protein